MSEPMKNIAASLLRGVPGGGPSLAHCLQGVQHFGVTVDDMAKSIEFYTNVLGGKLALSGDGFTGEVLHNTLFQKEDLDALSRGDASGAPAVPDLRDGKRQALDVRFISFGNTCVELIHFRDARLDFRAPNWGPRLPSSIGPTNASHLSFHVKDDVDLNLFARELEEECQRRGITQVVCNRIIHVNSEAERKEVALKYYTNRFWNDPDYYVEGYSDLNFGDFHGWSLFYCKGPNGEQLEFNQVTRKAKANFTRAQREYNEGAGTSFVWPSSVGGHRSELARAMFQAMEAMNRDEFTRLHTADAVYRLGNAPAVRGPQSILTAAADLRGRFARTRYRVSRVWEVASSVICDMELACTRHDGTVITLPACSALTFEDDRIREVQVYIDLAPLLAG